MLSISRPGHQCLTGIGKVRLTSLVYAIATGLMLGSLYFLSNRFGLTGAVLANFVMVVLLVYNIAMYKITGSKKIFRTFYLRYVLGIDYANALILCSQLNANPIY